ncbi:dienelactone hydrolase family protein [Humibacter ginsengisoli]
MSSSAIPGYADWPRHAAATPPLAATDAPTQALADVLGLRRKPEPPPVCRGESAVRDGVAITPLHWRMPYGPQTQAWELRPAESAPLGSETSAHGGDRGLLPGILALHPHGGRRSTGAAQLIDFDGDNPDAVANRLAKAGFVVLAHDTFSWASRRFDLSAPPLKLARTRDALLALWAAEGYRPSDDELFDAVSSAHEDLIAKTAGLLGQTFAGMVVTDDLVAADVLAGLPGVDSDRLGAIGFSGGGGRAHLLGALDDRIGAVVVACMMATFGSLVPDYVETHSWLLNSPGLPQVCDWPELARIGKARELLVLYGERDPLFPLEGMRAAHDALDSYPGYDGRFFDVGHEFTAEMLDAATEFFVAWRASDR